MVRWLVVLVVGLAAAGRGWGLAPDRALTQALHRIWQVQQGLPEATIHCVRQTGDGYLWLGTPKGLFRFDGVRFGSPVDRAVWVNDFVEGRPGELWVGTSGEGLLRVRGGEVTRFGRAEGMPSEDVRAVMRDGRGVVWACTARGLVRVEGEKVSVVTGGSDLHAIGEGTDGVVYVGGAGASVSTWDGKQMSSRRLTSVPGYANVTAIRRTRDGVLWVGTTAGLVRIINDREELITTAQGLGDEGVQCVLEGADGTLWVGTKDGFGRVRPDGKTVESFRAREGLSQSTVYTLCEDREGTLWVGTKHGLNQFLDRRTVPFTASEGLASNNTGPVFQDGAGTVWVGTLDAGLSRYDGRGFTGLSAREGLASNAVRALADDGGGGVWVGTDRGLSRLREGRVVRTYTTKDGLASDDVRCLARDAAGVLWAGTAAGPVVLSGERFVEPAGGAVAAPVVAMVGRRDGTVAVATGAGVYRYAGGRRIELLQGDGPRRDVDSFFEDAEGVLWVGTLGRGLRRVAGDGRVTAYTAKDGLFDDDIYGIVADDQDRLWMACSKGIFFVARAELNRFAAGEVRTVASTPFSPTDAQRTIECKAGVEPAAWRMADGRLWFSTIRGVIVVDPTKLQRRLQTVPVVIEDVIVNGRSEATGAAGAEGLRLPPGPKNLEFRYTALSFLAPGRITFRYRLEGFERDWVEAAGRREAFYTNLPPGDYRFRVAAVNVDQTTNESGAGGVAVGIAPHFYQRGWFWPMCGAAVGAGVWAAYRVRVGRIKERMRTVVAERSRIARELHDTLLQGFSGVTMEMQALAARLPATSTERGALEEIIRDAGACMREARRSVAGLRSAGTQGEVGSGPSGLAAAIGQAARQITETRDVRLRLELPAAPVAGLAADVEYNLLRIAAEAVSNAARHAGAGTIEVALASSGNRLDLSVRDDGVGFAVDGNGGGEHYGLVGMRERAAQIGADFDLTSEPGRGTVVRVRMTMAAMEPAHSGGES